MEDTAHYWVLLVYAVAVIGLVAGMIGASYVLGQRHMKRATREPFESGIVPSAMRGSACRSSSTWSRCSS